MGKGSERTQKGSHAYPLWSSEEAGEAHKSFGCETFSAVTNHMQIICKSYANHTQIIRESYWLATDIHRHRYSNIRGVDHLVDHARVLPAVSRTSLRRATALPT